MIALYPDQVFALNEIARCLRAGARRIVLRLPTGGGKTVVAARMVLGARAKGKRVCFVVDAVSLIDQTVQRFYEFGIQDIGVIQSDHPMTDFSKPVQVASIQTLANRNITKHHFDLVIADEVHCVYKRFNEWMVEWNNIPFIGLSATPWTKGMAKNWDTLINAATIGELIENGRLSPYRMFAPAHPDLTGVRTSNGDYQINDLSERMSAGALVANMTKNWREQASDRPTLVFCVDRVHAKHVQSQFLSEGISCGYIDAYTPRDERQVVADQFHSGELRIVASVGCLTKGIDWDVRCILLARPTKSPMLYIQIIGRGLRVAEGKDYCLILDHSDTALRLGLPEDVEAEYTVLDDGTKSEAGDVIREEALPKECGSCGFVKPPKVHMCPSCGFAPERRHEVNEVEARLAEIKRRKNRESTPEEKGRFYAELMGYALERGFKPGWAAKQYREKFGVWPNKYKDVAAQTPTTETRKWCKSRLIAYAKGTGTAA